MITGEQTPRPTGPLNLKKRAPAPDLARGFMLLLIVLANTPAYLYANDHSPVGLHPVDGSVLDRIVQGLLITTVDLRVYPMFAFLFGYGLWMVYRRQREAGFSPHAAARILYRRNAWLIVFGLVHAFLLWGSEILGAYGLCGLLIVWLFIRRTDRTLLVWSSVGVFILAVFAALSIYGAVLSLTYGQPMAGPDMATALVASISEPNAATAALQRLMIWPFQTVIFQGPVTVVVPVAMLLGIWAARRRILEHPTRHRRLLRVTAGVGLLVGWVGALPHALAHVGVLEGLEGVMVALFGCQLLTGLACGLGYVAVFGLIGARVEARPAGRIRLAITALGRRSLSGYLAQSVLCAPVLAAWGLGVGALLSSSTVALYAIAVWLVTVILAVLLERRGSRGPAESLLRTLTYRPVPTSKDKRRKTGSE